MYSQVTVKKVSSVKGGYIQSSGTSGRSFGKISVGRYASSVHAGGLGTRISSSASYGGVTAGQLQLSSSRSDVLLCRNEKETMQNLNDRLATYLEKVRSLEKANAQLEGQIKEWYGKNSTTAWKRDDSSYFQVVEDLRTKIYDATLDNAKILLQIDNSRLAAADFKFKFENEQALRATVEKDISVLRNDVDQFTFTKAELEAQVETMKEELVYLKKNHAEELGELRKQVSGTVNVEVDVAPSVDMAKTIEDMRAQYETLVEKQRADAKYWFDKKVEEWSEEIQTSTTELETYRREVTDGKHKAQGLEVQLQAESSTRKAMIATSDNTSAQYATQLAAIQSIIAGLEAHHQQIRSESSHQGNEYGLLLDIKTRLETEIATYRQLLEGEEVRSKSKR
ncbi:keratin, type I cytoskeletal 19-like [Ascaphus truei]|uniref:keratin, type I cytoskeletal 19-like n=1 Tax=Ascaphus truei TaxID=8439 RepID=UPI003F5981CA